MQPPLPPVPVPVPIPDINGLVGLANSVSWGAGAMLAVGLFIVLWHKGGLRDYLRERRIERRKEREHERDIERSKADAAGSIERSLQSSERIHGHLLTRHDAQITKHDEILKRHEKILDRTGQHDAVRRVD